jgi:uncharacterized protein DUF2550
MAWWEAILDSIGLVALFVVLAFVFLFGRRRWISRGGGTFECSVRMRAPMKNNAAASARGWVLGLGRYTGDQLEWFRIFSFSPRPKHSFRRSLAVLTRRTPHGAEAFSLYSGHKVVSVRLDDQRSIELAMSESALTGFLAWTEAAPPGNDRSRR